MAEAAWVLPVAGCVAGIVIGAVARHQRFCILSGLERFWYANDSSGVRTWALTAAVAIIATQAMLFSRVIDLGGAFYLTPNFGWTGAIVGGLMFGWGMALVGTCGFGALIRLGGGNLRSFVVLLVLGLSALATQRGLLALARVEMVDNLTLDLEFAGSQSIGSLVSAALGFDAHILVACVIVAVLLGWIFYRADYRRRYAHIATATTIGLVVAFGWLATSWTAANSFEPVQLESAAFVAPVGDTILQFVTFTGALPDYGVGMIIGVVLGAALVAWRRHDVRWEACDDARELGRHIAGGFLMGSGGISALGCTIGQGVSAASTLALSAPVVVAAIVIGARLGLAFLLEGSVWYVFRGNVHKPAE